MRCTACNSRRFLLVRPKHGAMDFDVGAGDEATESELPALKQLVAMGYKYKTQADLNKIRRDYREALLYDRLEKSNPEM